MDIFGFDYSMNSKHVEYKGNGYTLMRRLNSNDISKIMTKLKCGHEFASILRELRLLRR